MVHGMSQPVPSCPSHAHSVPATWELYVEMRFTQLRTACDLELWAEAFRRCGRWVGWLAAAGVGPSSGIVLARECADMVVGLAHPVGSL